MACDQKSVVSLGYTSVFRPAWDAQECHEEERNLGRVVEMEVGREREGRRLLSIPEHSYNYIKVKPILHRKDQEGDQSLS